MTIEFKPWIFYYFPSIPIPRKPKTNLKLVENIPIKCWTIKFSGNWTTDEWLITTSGNTWFLSSSKNQQWIQLNCWKVAVGWIWQNIDDEKISLFKRPLWSLEGLSMCCFRVMWRKTLRFVQTYHRLIRNFAVAMVSV